MAKKPKPPPPTLGDAPAPTSRPIVLGGESTGHPIWDRPITPKQLARFLQVSPRTVSRLTKERSFPRIVVGGQTRFVPNDVLNYLRKSK